MLTCTTNFFAESLEAFIEAVSSPTAMTRDEMIDWIESKKLRNGFGKLDYEEVKHMSGYGDYWLLEDIPLDKVDGKASFPPRRGRRRTPIIVAGSPSDGYEVLDGRHRTAEARNAGEKTIKAWVGYWVEDQGLRDAINAMTMLEGSKLDRKYALAAVRSLRARLPEMKKIFGTRAEAALTRYKTVSEHLLIEMASKSWNQYFEPGWHLYVHADMDQGPSERLTKYVVGILKGSKDKEQKLYKTYENRPYSTPVQFKPEMTLADAIRFLREKGYKDITAHDPLKDGKAKYFHGERRSGVVRPFKGVVYHGTPDIKFFTTIEGASDLGRGSHLKSLNGDGDALSLTTAFKVAAEFANDDRGIGMIVEMKADLNVYYAGRGEDDYDEIDPPDEADAVAIPVGNYDEKEIALLRWDNNLDVIAVHLQIGKKWHRYATTQSEVNYHGEWIAYVREWLEAVFGKDFSEVVEKHSGSDNPDSFELEDGTLRWPDLTVFAATNKMYFEHTEVEGQFFDATSFLKAAEKMTVQAEGYEYVGSHDPSSLVAGDRIVSAAAFVYATKKLYTGTHHGDAVQKAKDAGEDIMDPDDPERVDLDKIHVDLFLTRNNKVLDRFGADQHFGVAGSEHLHLQKQP